MAQYELALKKINFCLEASADDDVNGYFDSGDLDANYDIDFIRARPESIEYLIENTKYSRKALQMLYRGFKQVLRQNFKQVDKSFKQLDKKFKKSRQHFILFQNNAAKRNFQDFFVPFQACPLGYVTLEQFQKIYSFVFPFSDSTKYAEFVFNAIKKDKDGLLTFEVKPKKHLLNPLHIPGSQNHFD